MFLHCFPIIPVAMEQCDTKRQSLQNFFSNTKKPQNARFFTHSKRPGIFPCFFDFSSVLVFFHSQRLNQCRKLGQIPDDNWAPAWRNPISALRQTSSWTSVDNCWYSCWLNPNWELPSTTPTVQTPAWTPSLISEMVSPTFTTFTEDKPNACILAKII